MDARSYFYHIEPMIQFKYQHSRKYVAMLFIIIIIVVVVIIITAGMHACMQT